MTRLRVIRYASWFHISFGASILAFPFVGVDLPSPFGSLGAYLQYLYAWQVAAMFILCGALSALALRLQYHQPWLMVASVVPQQFILLWAVFWGIATLIQTAVIGHEIDSRVWLGVCQFGGLSWYHGRELVEVWTLAWSLRGVRRA